MRVAHVGNMANDGFACVEALRAEGVDAELVIDETEFGMSMPQWETSKVKGDPYKMDPDSLPPLPDYVRTWRSNRRNFLYRVAELNRITRDYDLLHLHFPTMLYLAYSKTPYLIYDAGFARQRYGSLSRNNRTRLAEESYQKAVGVTYNNTDMRSMIYGMRPKRMDFVPFAINTERYRPAEEPLNDRLEFIHPARMVFDVKGNDRMLRAFRSYVEGGGDAHLTLVDWGYEEDVAEAHKIVESLGDRVTWVPPMCKPDLIETYHRCDAVLDQFTLGASGTTGFETMACGVPLMIYFSESAAEHFHEYPPCVNVSTTDEILRGFTALESEALRDHLRDAGRMFVERHLSYPVVARKLKILYEEVR